MTVGSRPKPLLVILFCTITVATVYLYYQFVPISVPPLSKNQISLKGTVIFGNSAKFDHLCANENYLVTQNGTILLVLDKKGTVVTQRYFSPYLNKKVNVVGVKRENPNVCITENTECVCNSDFILQVDNVQNDNVLFSIYMKLKQLFKSRL